MKKNLQFINLFLIMFVCLFSRADGHGTLGMWGNGTWNNYIDIYNAPFSTMANDAAWGPNGCAWYATARARQITGNNDINIINDGNGWWNNGAGLYGYKAGTEFPSSGKALVCYTGHVAVIEGVSGNNVLVSECGKRSMPPVAADQIWSEGMGSWWDTSAHDYCVQRVWTKEQVLNPIDSNEFRGFVYLTGSPQNNVPLGNIDSMWGSQSGTMHISGWTFDWDRVSANDVGLDIYLNPDTSNQIQLPQVHANGIYRHDVEVAYPGAGDYHGFELDIDVAQRGTYDVRVWAIGDKHYTGIWDATVIGTGKITVTADYAKPIMRNQFL